MPSTANKDDPAGWKAWNDEDDADNARSTWTRSSDPVFGDSANAVALREHLNGSAHLQPYRHSADRYFPSSALFIPGLQRYVPTIATTDYFMSNSRGPVCVDANNKSYKCHQNNRLPAFMYTHPRVKCANATNADRMTVLARWGDDGKLQACLFCHKATKLKCLIPELGILMLPRAIGATPDPADDQLESEDDGGDVAAGDEEAGLQNPSPAHDPETPVIPHESPRTPNKRDRSPTQSIPSVPERQAKRTRETESGLTPQGLPANPKRPLVPEPKSWLQARSISSGVSKGKDRSPSERPPVPANAPTVSPNQSSIPTISFGEPFADPHPHPHPFAHPGHPRAPETTAPVTLPSAQQPSFEPYHRAASPKPHDIITANRSSTKDAFAKARDSLQETLLVFETAASTADGNSKQQYRLLTDADGARSRAEADLGKERETSRTLKARCTATENRNAELSEKNRQLASKVSELATELLTKQANHDSQIAELVAAKEAAEALHDEATKERKNAFAACETAQNEAAEHKQDAEDAAAVVERAIAEKEAKEEEANELRGRLTEMEALANSLRSDANAKPWEPMGEPGPATDEELQLGMAGSSSY